MTSRPGSAKRLGLVCALVAFQAAAQTPKEPASADSKAAARAHFERGVAFVGEGKLEAAVAEFETAYRASPRYSVLFNLGQAQAAMGHSVEAVAAFRRYLDDGGSSIDAERRKYVSELIAFHEARVGTLRLDVQPNGAEVSLDGRLVGKSPLPEPMRVVAGTHALSIKKAGYSDIVMSVEVKSGAVSEIVARSEISHAAAPQAVLAVHCAVPDVELFLDGQSVGRTPDARLLSAPAGSRTLRFSRSGYLPDERGIELDPARPVGATCRLRPVPGGPSGTLRVQTTPTDAVVVVDGSRFDRGRLPIGRHALRVERTGYHPSLRFVTIESDRTAEVAATLSPTKEQADAWRAADSSRKTWALALTIGGAVLVGTAVGTYVWNSGRLEDWHADRREVDAALAEGPITPALLEENAALDSRAASIRSVDDLALVLGVTGGITLGVSGGLWLGLGRP